MSSPPGSKQKTKQKKSEQTIELQQQVQTLIKENLELSITVKRLNEKIVSMKAFENTQQATHQQSAKLVSAKMEKLELTNLAKDEHIKALRQKKEKYEIQNGCLNYKIQKLKKQFEQFKTLSKLQLEEITKHSDNQIRKYELTVNEYQMAINQRLQYLSANQKLKHQLDLTNEEHKTKIADKDREKLQTIDFLKKEMHQKTKQLKANLLTMRRDQMATNTRLTVLQNHQLLEELEYQSKHTQKILKRNQQLQKKVECLSKELELEKQINEELAKRSSIAKKIIKSINDKNSVLEKQLQQVSSSVPKDQTLNRKSSLGLTNCQQVPLAPQQTLKSYSNTIKLLQSQINRYQQRLKHTQQQKVHFQQLYETNQPLYDYYLKTQSDLRLLMVRFLSSATQGKLTPQQNSLYYDISRLKNLPVNEWSDADIHLTIQMLLTFIKPHFNIKNMKVHYLKYSKWNLSPQDSIDQLVKNQENINEISHQHKPKHTKIKSLSSAALNNISKPNSQMIHASTNNSPRKQFSLHNLIQDYKSKSLSKNKKCRSQHNISSSVDNKFISGQHSTFKPYDNSKQNHQHGFQPQHFKNKESKKLVRTNIRDWGKKIQMHSRASLLMKAS